jgi:hypothetical protein
MSYSRFALLILRALEAFSAKVAYNYGVLFPDPEISRPRHHGPGLAPFHVPTSTNDVAAAPELQHGLLFLI